MSLHCPKSLIKRTGRGFTLVNYRVFLVNSPHYPLCNLVSGSSTVTSFLREGLRIGESFEWETREFTNERRTS